MKHDPVEFNTIRQEYSEYETENGLRIKVMPTVTHIVNEDGANEVGKSKVTAVTVAAVVAPQDFDRSGLKERTGSTTKADETHELAFKLVKKAFNIYETKKFIIVIGIKLIKVYGTDRVNNMGEPVLHYKHKNSINMIEKTDP